MNLEIQHGPEGRKTFEPIDQIWANLPELARDILDTFSTDAVIAGACVRDGLRWEEWRDIDIFVKSRAVADEIRTRFFFGQNHDTTDNAYMFNVLDAKIQIIYGFPFERVADLLAGFDFLACQVAIEIFADVPRIVATDAALKDIADKVLRYTCPERDEDGTGSIFRAIRLAQRGWIVSDETTHSILKRVCYLAKSGVSKKTMRHS